MFFFKLWGTVKQVPRPFNGTTLIKKVKSVEKLLLDVGRKINVILQEKQFELSQDKKWNMCWMRPTRKFVAKIRSSLDGGLSESVKWRFLKTKVKRAVLFEKLRWRVEWERSNACKVYLALKFGIKMSTL